MSIDLNSKCRTCLSESNTFYKIYDCVAESCKILDMLDCIVPQINIRLSSQFSPLICQMCVDQLLIGYKFQQLCLKSNERLRDLVGIGDVIGIRNEEIEEIVDLLNAETDCRVKIEIGDTTCVEDKLTEEKKPDDLRLEINSEIEARPR